MRQSDLIWNGEMSQLEAMFDVAAYRAKHHGFESETYLNLRDNYIRAIATHVSNLTARLYLQNPQSTNQG